MSNQAIQASTFICDGLLHQKTNTARLFADIHPRVESWKQQAITQSRSVATCIVYSKQSTQTASSEPASAATSVFPYHTTTSCCLTRKQNALRWIGHNNKLEMRNVPPSDLWRVDNLELPVSLVGPLDAGLALTVCEQLKEKLPQLDLGARVKLHLRRSWRNERQNHQHGDVETESKTSTHTHSLSLMHTKWLKFCYGS